MGDVGNVLSPGDVARINAVIKGLNIPPRSGKPVLVEWLCAHCDRWYIWPHTYPPPKHLAMQFQWRYT